MEELVTKSRNLSLTDFYSILQQEYISYYVRSKTYPSEYAKKYAEYCACKKDKIEKIGIKNQLPSIFNSESIKGRYIDKFFNEYGLPNFEYRDENSVRIMGKWDAVYWFSEGTSIKIRVDGEMVPTIVIKNLFNSSTIIAEVNGEVRQFSYGYVSRLISDNIINF
jgi:hypothetical protein